jgi:hypothetical protein
MIFYTYLEMVNADFMFLADGSRYDPHIYLNIRTKRVEVVYNML